MKRSFLMSQYVGHVPHDYHHQLVTIRTPYGNRLLSCMGHFLEFIRMTETLITQATPYHLNGMIYYMGIDDKVYKFPISEFMVLEPTFEGPSKFTTQTDTGEITIHYTVNDTRDLIGVIEDGLNKTRLSAGS